VKCLFSGITLDSYPNKENNTLTEYKFEQKIKVPTYLIILAAGDLEYRATSERCGVWAEPALVERAKYEFEDAETYLKAVLLIIY
jgi:aminopeptidase N